MAREMNRLSVRGIAALKEPGRHSDGGGLYLVVDKSGAKRWVFLFRWQGKLKEMGLGSALGVSLVQARAAAAIARNVVATGRNPIEERRSATPAVPTFAEMAESVIDGIAHGLRNAKHIAQWRMTLSVERGDDGELVDSGYCQALRAKRVSEVETADVLAVLQPIWTVKAETAAPACGVGLSGCLMRQKRRDTAAGRIPPAGGVTSIHCSPSVTSSSVGTMTRCPMRTCRHLLPSCGNARRWRH